MKDKLFVFIAFFANKWIWETWAIGKNCLRIPVGQKCCRGYSWNDDTKLCQRCHLGYFGFNCTSKCRFPSYGEDCQGKCDCPYFLCHHVHGCQLLTTERMMAKDYNIPDVTKLLMRNNLLNKPKDKNATNIYNPSSNLFSSPIVVVSFTLSIIFILAVIVCMGRCVYKRIRSSGESQNESIHVDIKNIKKHDKKEEYSEIMEIDDTVYQARAIPATELGDIMNKTCANNTFSQQQVGGQYLEPNINVYRYPTDPYIVIV